MMKDKLLLILAILAFSLVPLVQVVTADTMEQDFGDATGWNTLFGPTGSSSHSGTDWIFGPVTPSPTPEGGYQWFPGGERFVRPALPKRPDMNYSAFYLIFKPNSTGYTLPSPYPTPSVLPTWTSPTPRPMPIWTIPTMRPMPILTIPTPRPMPTWTIPIPGTIPTVSPTYSPTPAGAPVSQGEVVLTDLNLVQEYVKIRNNGQDRIDMTGWRLCDRAGHCINFIEWENGYRFELLPFSTLTIYSDQTGSPSNLRLYWPEEMWNDRGDTASLYNAEGTLVSTITR
jgi:hypothetical protein